jgi:DNA-binding transcriptional MerR regulator
MFTIGAFARLCGVSARALRAYDAIGLFRPAWVDRDSGYRRYSPAQLPEIRRILSLRAMGMGLEDIGDALRAGDLRGALARREATLLRERVELERRLAELKIRVEQDPADGDGLDIVVRTVGREAVATLDLDLVAGGDPEAGFDELEAAVRDAGLRAQRPPGMFPDDSTAGVVFVPVRRSFPPTGRLDGRILPETRVATILHRGGYDGLDAARRALEGWVAGAGLQPAGSLRILYLQFGAAANLRLHPAWLVGHADDFLTELQQPISTEADGAMMRR